MAEYDDKEKLAMPTHSIALPPPVGLSVVNKRLDQTSNDSSASSQNELAESERLPASLRSNIEPQSLGILDLADELLLNIFDHAADAADIRNIRLTCRRFCSTSSHLLLDCLDVRLTAASLARAEEISCHPTISKGIRVLHISLRSHSALSSLSSFRSFAISYLQDNFSLNMRSVFNDFKNGDVTSFTESRPILREKQRLLSSWSQYKEETKHLTHQQGLDVEVLHQGYEKYRMAYEWQKRAVQDGTFAQAIAAAVGRMPKATKLVFTSKFRYRERSSEVSANMRRNHTSTFDVFDDRMMLSMGADWLRSEGKPAELAVQVPLAIHTAGFPAVEIGIECVNRSCFSPHTTWIRDQAQLLGLKAAAESLQVFTFEGHIKSYRPADDISSPLTYLRIILEAANLQVLTFSASSYHSNRDVGSLLAPLRWPHLREINLAHVAFHLNELKRFVDGLRPGILLRLKWVHLCSGTWAEGLEALRTKANAESQVSSLAGAECSSMSFGQYTRILDGGHASRASRYVQGVSIHNPFLVTEDETADEETADEETADEETADEETADEETADEETADEETADEETADEETNVGTI